MGVLAHLVIRCGIPVPHLMDFTPFYNGLFYFLKMP